VYLYAIFNINNHITECDKKFIHKLFHEHGHPTDQNMKERLRKKLENDEYCNNQLCKMKEKGVSYDQLWSDKLYSTVSKVIFY
jgi:hypothetical protein